MYWQLSTQKLKFCWQILSNVTGQEVLYVVRTQQAGPPNLACANHETWLNDSDKNRLVSLGKKKNTYQLQNISLISLLNKNLNCEMRSCVLLYIRGMLLPLVFSSH